MPVGSNYYPIVCSPPASTGAKDLAIAQNYTTTLRFKPKVCIVSNPGDFWVHLTNIRQWVAPGTPNAIYWWNGDLNPIIDTSSQPNNSYPFVPGTGQSAEPATVIFTDDPSVQANPGVINRVLNPQATLIGQFDTTAGQTGTNFGPYQVPANTQSIMVVWAAASSAGGAQIPTQLGILSLPTVGGIQDTVAWAILTASNTPAGAITDSLVVGPFSCSVAQTVTIFVQEQAALAQHYWVLASPVPIATATTLTQSDIQIPVAISGFVAGTSVLSAILGTPGISLDTAVTTDQIAVTALTSRKAWYLQNVGTVNLRVQFGNPASSGGGIRVLPNQLISQKGPGIYQGDIHVISESGASGSYQANQFS